ncbi:MAG: UDP-N-acetylmuramate dehydrogenase [Candidatus Paceibacterota bacterium]
MFIKENVPLKDFTTMRVGGPARFFVAIESLEELKNAIVFARKKNLPIFILGGGSNIIVSDEGFAGVVIKMEIRGIEIQNYELRIKNKVLVTAGAGEDWDNFVGHTVSKNLYGIENLSYIPGTVGATPIQNVGAYGTEVSKTIKEVHVFDIERMKEKVFSNKDCGFSYRDSIFKKKENNHLVVTHVTFLLKEDGNVNIEYKDVREYFGLGSELRIKNYELEITARDVREAVIAIRKRKLPDPHHIGTVGSYFKNPVLIKEQALKLKRQYPDMPMYPMENYGVKVPLAWILDHVCGLKGAQEGVVGLYENQPLALVHFGGGSTKGLLFFAEKVKCVVKEKTGIEIEEEVVMVSE